jgi:hypothetical protein
MKIVAGLLAALATAQAAASGSDATVVQLRHDFAGPGPVLAGGRIAWGMVEGEKSVVYVTSPEAHAECGESPRDHCRRRS